MTGFVVLGMIGFALMSLDILATLQDYRRHHRDSQ